MATLPALFRRTETQGGAKSGTPSPAPRPEPAVRPVPVRTGRDPFQLRALPMEDVFFYCKKIDNGRLVRVPDPRAPGACRNLILVFGAMVGLLAGVMAPRVANTLAGYKLEALRAEEQQLLDERRVVELQEAYLLSPARLDMLAHDHNLVAPRPGQEHRLDAQPDGAVARVNRQ